jgi:mRNA interferase RelE/StbE
MKFVIEFKTSVEKDLRKIASQQAKIILTAIKRLEAFPEKGDIKKLSNAVDTYRMRVGNYRVIFKVDFKSRIITVYYIRHRQFDYKY